MTIEERYTALLFDAASAHRRNPWMYRWLRDRELWVGTIDRYADRERWTHELVSELATGAIRQYGPPRL